MRVRRKLIVTNLCFPQQRVWLYCLSLVACLIPFSTPRSIAQDWKPLVNAAPASIQLMVQMTDGTLLARIREVIGPNRPLIATLDFHGNVSPLMASASDALVAYRTYPHVDPLYRTNALFAEATPEHAHNDYLEILVEGGAGALLLGLLAIGLVFRSGLRALTGRPGAPAHVRTAGHDIDVGRVQLIS